MSLLFNLDKIEQSLRGKIRFSDEGQKSTSRSSLWVQTSGTVRRISARAEKNADGAFHPKGNELQRNLGKKKTRKK